MNGPEELKKSGRSETYLDCKPVALNNPRILDAKSTTRKTDTMKRLVVQQYLGYQVSLVSISC
jgi:hypothetical protein